MLEAVLGWWRFNAWFGAACLVVGAAIVAPLLASKSARRRLARPDIDPETIGLIAVVVTVALVGLYNYFGRSSGA